MRIVVANDGFGDAGGVQAYLTAVMDALGTRAHALAVVSCSGSGDDGARAESRVPHFLVPGPDSREQLAAIRAWAPDICYSHNMDDVGVDTALAAIAPVVKFMHGYFGTCIGGLKMHAFPAPVPCDRVYGAACAALYFPRRCGRLSATAFLADWRHAKAYRRVQNDYAAMIVASEHMRREYVGNGVDAARVHVNRLFPTHPFDAGGSIAAADPHVPHVVFLARMTRLKGGDLLINAVHRATSRLGRPIRLTMIGDGPQRGEWETLARRLGVASAFTGWLDGDVRWTLVRAASVVAVPSVWPEPFGLVGLEAGALGVPAVAIAAGGIGEWLRDGVNGVAVPAPASSESFGDALAALLGDPDRLAALRVGARRVARDMTLDGHIDRLESIFNNVLTARG
jgi:glycosyltransferase involved in cell wall biosynthesis